VIERSLIVQALASVSAEVFLFGNDVNRDYLFLSRLLSAEPVPIFEHSVFYVLGSLSHNNALYGVTGAFGHAVCAVSADSVYLFSPAVLDTERLTHLIASLVDVTPGNQLDIRYLTERWVSSTVPSLGGHGVTVRPRSAAEAVYECSRLVRLDGPDFRNLRARRRKLLDSGRLRFLPLDADRLPDAFSILQCWQATQGQKYQKNRYDREAFTLRRFVELSKRLPIYSSFEVGYCEERPVSIACFYRSERLSSWGAICFIKAINRPEFGGISGASDATYCHVFLKADSLGLTHLNDGELGTENGTRNHKLQFQPVMFLRSFDVVLRRQ
jgi:hypothetical protein